MQVNPRNLPVSCLIAALVGASAAADDLNPPPWRGYEGSTMQHWSFDTQPGSWSNIPPEIVNNPYGSPNAAACTFPCGNPGWNDTYYGRQGVLRFERLNLDIPNRAEPLQGKDIWLQAVFYDDGFDLDAEVTPQGPDSYSVTLLSEETTPLEGNWVYKFFKWEITPNPDSEIIELTASGKEMLVRVDQIVVDTICTDTLPTGACCNDSTGICTETVTAGVCVAGGGRYGGDDSNCATIEPLCVPPPTGACCDDPTGICTGGMWEWACLAGGGRYGGDDSNCATIDPPCIPQCPVITAPEPLNNNAATDIELDWFPQLTTDGAGTWIAVWESKDDLEATIGNDRDILVSRSTDHGATWTDPVALNTNATSDSGHDIRPQLTTDRAGIWLAVWHSNDDLDGEIGTDMDVLFSKSNDNGTSWSAPLPLNTDASTDSDSDIDGTPQLTTDRQGNWIAVWISNDEPFGPDYDIIFSRSSDNGTNWTDPQPLNTNANSDGVGDVSPQLTTDGLGKWVAVWNTNPSDGSDTDILFASSTNNGATWTPPQALNTNAAVDDGNDWYPQLTTDGVENWIAVWESNENLDGAIGTDNDIFYSRSIDNGASWTPPQPLNTNAAVDSGWDAGPELTTDGEGNWVAAWASTDDLGGTIGTDYDIFYSRSTDHGVTWTAPIPLNTNAVLDSLGNEKPQICTDEQGNWVAVWYSRDTLGETIGTDRDILVARFQLVDCNTNGIPDECETLPPGEIPSSTCDDGEDNDCDGFADCDDPDCASDSMCQKVIPTVSEWGLVVMTLLLLTVGTVVLRGRRTATG